MAVHLDTTDCHIIALLVEDGRLSSAEIARRIGHVSERSVRYRIDRLRRTGVMRVTAIVSPQALGYTTIGDISISVLPGTLQDVAARLVDCPQVSYVAGSVGDGDLVVQVYARDPEELVRYANEVIGTIPGVSQVKTTIVPWKLKEVCDWRVPPEGEKEGQ